MFTEQSPEEQLKGFLSESVLALVRLHQLLQEEAVLKQVTSL